MSPYDPHPADQQWTDDDLQRASDAGDTDAINTARRAGHLHNLITPPPAEFDEEGTAIPPAPRGPVIPTEGSGEGNRASGPSQLAETDLARMTSDQINQARREGKLDNMLGH